MKDIIFYDKNFAAVGIFGKYISSNWTVKYRKYGTFEAHFPISETRLVDMLDGTGFLYCCQGGEQAIVTGWRIDTDIAVYGKTLSYLLTKRGAAAYSYTDKTPEGAARAAVSAAMSDFLTLGSESGAAAEVKQFSSDSMKTVYDAVRSMLADTSLGFRVRADMSAKKLVFEVYSGAALSVLLSPSLKTAHGMTYTKEFSDMAHGCWYERKIECCGSWDSTLNSPSLSDKKPGNAYTYYRVSLGEGNPQFGLTFTTGSYIYSDTADGKWKMSEKQPDSVWVYLSGSTSAAGAEKWDAVLSGAMTEDEARAELAARAAKETVDGEIRKLTYGTNYKLGDTVRVQYEADRFRKTARRRITAVNIFCEGNSSGVVPEFGE